MAETIKTYVSKENLTRYDGKIKKVITDADAKVLADAKTYADEKVTAWLIKHEGSNK